MTQPRPPLRAIALAAAVLCLGACGSGSASVDRAAPAPTAASATPEETLTVSDPSPGPADDTSTPDTTGDDELRADSSGAPTAPAPEPSPTASGTSAAQPAESGSARALLATLAVKGRAALTGYEREQYGQAWADVDRNGCDTRNDILRRDLREEVLKPGTHDCVVLSGLLDPEPYTGARMDFVRGETTSSAVQIDHVVALADSWVTGAYGWDERKRIAFGNDPLNLLAVDGPANSQKGAGDAATWLPRSAYRCPYVARQISVKAKYGLWVKPAERDAMNRILATCPDQAAPPYGPVVLPPPGLGSSAPATPVATPVAGSGTDPRFPYCTDAKAAGYGPYTQGVDPEYDWYRDADRDGVVCE
ncbi:MAG TPA: DUF1524 domain-containing protein [Sporichthya sp.]|nr:DUF1524 domain-containing protein [Sporichthya sp.]